jgi:hypothetical protein
MSKKLSAALMDYAIESGEVEAEEVITPAGEEEITVITDETQSDLEEAVAELAEEVDKVEGHEDAAEQMIEAVESLEGYVAQFQRHAEAGVVINATAAHFALQGIVASLEARRIPEQIYSTEAFALAESFEADDKEADKGPGLLDKGKSLLTKLWNMLKAAAGAIKKAIVEFFTMMGKSAAAIKAAGEKLKEVGSKVKGTGSKKLSGSTYAALSTGGSIDPVKAMAEVNVGYKTAVVANIVKLRVVVNPLVKALRTPTAGGVASAAEGINVKSLESASAQLPGGMVAHFTVGSGEGLAALTDTTFKIEKSKDAVAVKEFDSLSGSDVVALGTALIATADLMVRAKTDADAILKQNDDLLAAAGTAINAAKDDASSAAARDLMKTATKLLSVTKGFVPTYVRYMGATAKVAYKAGMASAGAAGKEAKPAGTPDPKVI